MPKEVTASEAALRAAEATASCQGMSEPKDGCAGGTKTKLPASRSSRGAARTLLLKTAAAPT